MKRGQVTIFLIIAVLMIVIIGSIVYWNARVRRKPIEVSIPADSSSLTPVSTFVSLCLESTGKDALLLMGQQGRLKPQAAIQSSDDTISYFYYKGTQLFPSDISILEGEVSEYIEDNLDKCLDGFNQFDYNIESYPASMEVTTKFHEKDVLISATYPVVVKMGESSTTLSDFSANIDLNFKPIYKLAQLIFLKTVSDPNFINIEFLNNQVYEVTLGPADRSTLIYVIKDTVYGLDNEPYVYRFAFKFDI